MDPMTEKVDNIESVNPRRQKQYRNFMCKTEKTCAQCGFTTFCLPVLYRHKYRCMGTRLGPVVMCTYCKRRFPFPFLYKKHKVTCVRFQVKQRIMHKKFLAKWRKSKVATAEEPPKRSIVCPTCMKIFEDKLLYTAHLDLCSSKVEKKYANAARKSFPHKRNKVQIDSEDTLFNESSNFKSKDENVYPTKEALVAHLGVSEESTESFVNRHKKHDLRARKSMPSHRGGWKARKSFPHSYSKVWRNSVFEKFPSGSARKSFTKSYRRTYTSTLYRSRCPVCTLSFPDIFNLLMHQNRFNHWGKAAKTMNSVFKCPFCRKAFYHLRSRVAHVKNHGDLSKKQIEAFLEGTTCKKCSQVFVNHTVKVQHMRIEHGTEMNRSTSSWSDVAVKSQVRAELDSGYIARSMKKRPTTCPMCLKTFATREARNTHFSTHHTEKTFECRFCEARFAKDDKLINHLQQYHDEDLEFECLECKLGFATRMSVVHHAMRMHQEQNPRDLILMRESKPSFHESYKMKKPDVTAIQPLEEPKLESEVFYCSTCEISFQKLCGLQRHRKSKFHRDTLTRNLDAIRKSLSSLPLMPVQVSRKSVQIPDILTCSQCSKDFASLSDFVPHRLSHFSFQNLGISESNPYTCEICEESLDYHEQIQHHLLEHLKSHSTQNQNKTSNVGNHTARKSFVTGSSVQQITIGGEKKPLFTCDACKIGFVNKIHFENHIQKLCRVRQTKSNANGTDQSSMQNSVSVVHCKDCSCLFSDTGSFEKHKDFCVGSLQNDVTSENKIETLKSNMEMKHSIAGCLRCLLDFETLEELSEHVPNCHPQKVSINKQLNNAAAELLFLTDSNDSSDLIDNQKMIISENSSEVPMDVDDTAIEALRQNCSHLLSVLVNDGEWLESFGYGKCSVDEVLQNVLCELGHTPYSGNEVAPLERLRKNVEILLEGIKDQINEPPSDKVAFVDERVVRILKRQIQEQTSEIILEVNSE